MNWSVASACLQAIASQRGELSKTLDQLFAEVTQSSVLSASEKAEALRTIDLLRTANIYGQISLLGRLKEIFAAHPGFSARHAEFGMQRK
jgi:hypothetical protein